MPTSVQGRARHGLPDVARLWRLASSVDLPSHERLRLDGAIAWAMGRTRLASGDELLLVRLVGAQALADGELHERELRLLLRTLLRSGLGGAEDLRLVREDLERVRDEVESRGAAPVFEDVCAHLQHEGVRRAVLRLCALCVASDHRLHASELGHWATVARLLGASPGEARDTLTAAASLYAQARAA